MTSANAKIKKRVLFVGKAGPLGEDILDALQNIGMSCQFFDYNNSLFFRSTLFRKILRRTRMLGTVKRIVKKRINQLLLNETLRFKPDILLIWNGELITPKTIEIIRSRQIITANWFLDLMTHWDAIKKIAPLYDYFFTPDQRVNEELKNMGIKSYVIPFTYKVTWDDFPTHTRPYNVTFIGSYEPSIWKKREELLSAIASFGLHIWGPSAWKKSAVKDCYRGTASGKEMIDIYSRSKIVIDIPWDHIIADTVSIRPYEATSAGACLFYYDIRPAIKKLFISEKEYIPFKDVEELKCKLRNLLDNPTDLEHIARAGFLRFMREHTYESRLRKIFSIIDSSA